ncbi:major Facilitator Superfamily protein, partial [Vibrio parahaemolyticus VP2007-007]
LGKKLIDFSAMLAPNS